MQERRNSIANTLELRLSCTKPSMCWQTPWQYSRVGYSVPVSNLHIDGLVQDCSNAIANALELRLSCTKPCVGKHLLLTIQLGLPIQCLSLTSISTVQMRPAHSDHTDITTATGSYCCPGYIVTGLPYQVKPTIYLVQNSSHYTISSTQSFI